MIDDDDIIHEGAAALREARAFAGLDDDDDEPVRRLHGAELRAARAAVGLDDDDDEPVHRLDEENFSDDERNAIPNVTDNAELGRRRAAEEADRAAFRRNADIPIPRRAIHPYLPIVAPDYSYVMDLTDMQSLLINRFRGQDGEDGEIADRVAEVYNRSPAPALNSGYRYILTLIDTTSRKVWMYPTRTKGSAEVYDAFQKFLKDVHGKVARLLSDNDSSFKRIRDNNDFFTYCSVTAAHNNHKTLSIIDRFTRTFRGLLYKTFRNYRDRYSWHDVYREVLDAYNNARHDALFLRGLGQRGNRRKFYYTPNQVWFSPRLRSRIRLRRYFDGVRNYGKRTMYDKIKKAERVHVRNRVYAMNKGGTNFFSAESYPKGIKRGNSWFVNGRWYTYRNLLPVTRNNLNDAELEERRARRSKYHLGRYIIAERPAPRGEVRKANKTHKTKSTREVGRVVRDAASFTKDRKGDNQHSNDNLRNDSNFGVGVKAKGVLRDNKERGGYDLRSKEGTFLGDVINAYN